MSNENQTTRRAMPEVPAERAMFDRQARLFGGPLRAMAAGLGTLSKAVPQGGSFAATLAIYANEAARAADAAGEPPVT